MDANGKVTALRPGQATIRAKSGRKSAYCKVTVKAKEVPVPVPVAVTGVVLDKDALSLMIGSSSTLTATVLPENAADKSVSWSSSNAAVATVDASGKVTAVALGEAVITAKAGDQTASCKVTVIPVPVNSVTLDYTELSLTEGAGMQLTATVSPASATDKTVTWSSSDESVVKVSDSGYVTTVGPGTATVTAKAGDKTATCAITVSAVGNGGVEGTTVGTL